jgi:leader peptidase (prepilin peptidase)/N-methyltransferase
MTTHQAENTESFELKNLTGKDTALDSKSLLPGGRTASGQPGGTYTPTSPKRSTVNEPEFDSRRVPGARRMPGTLLLQLGSGSASGIVAVRPPSMAGPAGATERGRNVTLPWIIAAAAAGLLAGPRIRASVFARGTEDSRPRRACPECSRQVLAGRWLWCSVLPVTGRCPHCKARIGPYALAAELVTAIVLAVIAARVPSGWELAALAWLALIAVPLAFIDIAVQRLPDLLTISGFAGTLVLLVGAEGAAHQPWPLVRAVIGAAALAGFYLALWLVFPDQLGLGDVKLAASIGLVLAWCSWSELFLGALAGALLGAAYARVLSARRGPAGPVYLPLGPFLLAGAFVAIALLPPVGSRS